MSEANGFTYTYSAAEQAADDALRRRYHLPAGAGIPEALRAAPEKERKEALRLLFAAAACNVLVFGSGMSLILTGTTAWTYPAGLLLGLTGLAGSVSMPMIYRKLLEKKRSQTEKRLAANETV